MDQKCRKDSGKENMYFKRRGQEGDHLQPQRRNMGIVM